VLLKRQESKSVVALSASNFGFNVNGKRKMKRSELLASTVSVLFVIASVSGCGGGGVGPVAVTPGEEGQIEELIVSMADYARSPETFNPLFAEGKAPNDKQRQQYNKWAIDRVEGGITIEGDSATIKVEIRDPDDFEVEIGDPYTWTAVKQDGEWKLDDAPLPAKQL